MPGVRRPALKGAASLLRQRSLSEGLWNGRKGWLAVGAVVWGARGVRYALHREERVVLREVLEPGETVIVRQVPTKAPKVKATKPSKAPKATKAAKAPKPSKAPKVTRRSKRKAKKQAKKLAKKQVKVEVKAAKVSRKDRKAITRAARAAA